MKWFWGVITNNHVGVPAPLKSFHVCPWTIFWEVVHDIQSHFLEMILRSQNSCWNDFRVGVNECWNDFRVWEVYVGKMISRGVEFNPQSVGVIEIKDNEQMSKWLLFTTLHPSQACQDQRPYIERWVFRPHSKHERVWKYERISICTTVFAFGKKARNLIDFGKTLGSADGTMTLLTQK